MIQIGLLGATGRMGKQVAQLIADHYSDQAKVSVLIGSGDALDPLLKTDVIIDFSLPQATLQWIEFSKGKNPPPLATGATGWTPEQFAALEDFSRSTPTLFASNFSLGVFSLHKILANAAPLLKSLQYTPVLVESHHRHKVDSPSGTALALQETVCPEDPRSIQTHAIRAGGVVGEHEFIFHSDSDEIRISHKALDRSIFARGAIEVALWLTREEKKPQGRLLEINDYFESLGTAS